LVQTSFDGLVGATTDLRTSVGVIRGCLLLTSAEVAEDESYVDLVFEVPTDVAVVVLSGLLG
jgi:hypothetical protein